MKKIWKDYFSFNSRERLSIILLCSLMAFFWVLPNWYPVTPTKPGSVGWNQGEIDSFKKISETTPKKEGIDSLKLFEFNPNELDARGWKKLGLKDKTIETILHYREKGGKFRIPSDLKKIWGFPIVKADQLIPYVRIENPVHQPQLIQKKAIPKWPDTVFINQINLSELALIPGFNKGLASRLIHFREKLGGFKNLEQVRRTYGLSDSLYMKLLPIMILRE